jgi:hypothetical protein
MWYRQITHRLRIHGAKGERTSERPRQGSRKAGWGEYTDSDEQPTLVEFQDGDKVDLAFLLQIGAIQEVNT